MNEISSLSSEMPNLILPTPYIHNSLQYNEHSINSLSSIRAGSVTIFAKNLAGCKYLSPKTMKKIAKLPFPGKTLTRIRKQNSQVKTMLKISSKNAQYFSPKSRKRKIEASENFRPKNLENKFSGKDESSVLNTESRALNLPLCLKISAKNALKNSKSENFSRPRVKKRLDQMPDIGFQKMKTCKGKEIGLSPTTPSLKSGPKKTKLEHKKKERFFEFKTCSKKKIGFELAKVLCKRKTKQGLLDNRDSAVITFSKKNCESAKNFPKIKQKKKLNKNENVFKEIKKINPGRVKEKSFKTKSFKKEASDSRKNLDLICSEKDLETPNFKKEFPYFFPSKNRENSAILIQSHVRKYFAKKCKQAKDYFPSEDSEVKNIISGWKKDSVELNKTCFLDKLKTLKSGQFDTLKRLRNEEIDQVKWLVKSSENPNQIIENLTKLINSRYQNIAKIIERKFENKNSLLGETQFLCRSEDSEKFELCRSESSASCEHRKTVSQLTSTNTKENSVTPFNGENKCKELWQSDLDVSKLPLSPSPNQLAVPAQSVFQISETIIEKLIQKELSKFSGNNLKEAVFDCFVESGTDFIFQNFEQLEKTLKRPLRKNPLEVLEKTQKSYTVNPLNWRSSGYPNIFPPFFCHGFSQLVPTPHESLKKNQVKMFFDCCNEIIQKVRPFGSEGAPMPWSRNKYSKFCGSKSSCKSFLLEKLRFFNSISAGKIAKSGFLVEDKLDELSWVREEKIGILIGEDVKDDEGVWSDYEFEETQLKIVLSEQIFELEVIEIINIIVSKF